MSMANYEFEINLTISDMMDIEADNVQEATDLAYRRSTEYQAVMPDGWSMPWDNVDVILVNSDGEDW